MAMHTVCRSDELAAGQLKVVTVADFKLVVYHLSDGFFATQANCTHLFAPLARGKIVADRDIQCPFHRACFNIRTGAVSKWANFPPGIQMLNIVRGERALRTFPVTVSGGEVQVSLPAA